MLSMYLHCFTDIYKFKEHFLLNFDGCGYKVLNFVETRKQGRRLHKNGFPAIKVVIAYHESHQAYYSQTKFIPSTVQVYNVA